MTGDLLWLPNLMILGFPKAGTSSVHRWLTDHPEVTGPVEKETYFFVDPGTHMYRAEHHIERGLETWRSAFAGGPHPDVRVTVESTPGHIYAKTALHQIPDLPSSPKCLFVVREPAAQIFSLFRYFQGNWGWVPSDMTFSEFLEAVRDGTHRFGGNELAQNCLGNARYLDHLLPWRERLGPDRMRVLVFEDIIRDPRSILKELASWVGVPNDFYDDYAFPQENETYSPRLRWLQAINLAVRERLPKGRLYDLIRKFYRTANAGKPGQPDVETLRVLGDLRGQFEEANKLLGDTFDLDLGAWNEAGIGTKGAD